jgi:hypothetical protein
VEDEWTVSAERVERRIEQIGSRQGRDKEKYWETGRIRKQKRVCYDPFFVSV